MPSMPRWLRYAIYTILIVGALVAIIVFPILSWSGDQEPEPGTKLEYWVATMIALTVFTFTLGYSIKHRILGALIDERNQMTLSRLQLIIWTVIVIAGYLTAALWNLLATEVSDPLAVGVPEELWWLLGISTTSFVGSPLILQVKKGQEENTTEWNANRQALLQQQGITNPEAVRNVGQVAFNATPEQARLADMFKGDETGNAPYLDMSKVQLFFFTIVIALAYGMGLGELFLTTTGAVEEFPGLSESILVLLGISHAGYLGYKSVSHSAPGDRPQVPDVIGQEVAVAEQAVRAAGLTPTTSVVRSQEPARRVLVSHPPVGTPLDPGGTVTLYYSSGP
jgi:Ca2+/Na+ antiporter